MSNISVNNWALGLALFSFGFLSLGSVIFGATVTTAVLRGFGGGVLFGVLLWLVGTMVSKEEISMDETILKGEGIRDLELTDTDNESMKPQDK